MVIGQGFAEEVGSGTGSGDDYLRAAEVGLRGVPQEPAGYTHAVLQVWRYLEDFHLALRQFTFYSSTDTGLEMSSVFI